MNDTTTTSSHAPPSLEERAAAMFVDEVRAEWWTLPMDEWWEIDHATEMRVIQFLALPFPWSLDRITHGLAACIAKSDRQEKLVRRAVQQAWPGILWTVGHAAQGKPETPLPTWLKARRSRPRKRVFGTLRSGDPRLNPLLRDPFFDEPVRWAWEGAWFDSESVWADTVASNPYRFLALGSAAALGSAVQIVGFVGVILLLTGALS